MVTPEPSRAIAVIITTPSVLAVTRPSESTRAISTSLLDQTTLLLSALSGFTSASSCKVPFFISILSSPLIIMSVTSTDSCESCENLAFTSSVNLNETGLDFSFVFSAKVTALENPHSSKVSSSEA